MAAPKFLILDNDATEARVKRMAFEIFERNYQEKEIFIIGVDYRGGYVAGKLIEHLGNISPLRIHRVDASLDREERQGKGGQINVEFSEPLSSLQNKSIVVVDDVLYSGNTMMHVVAPLLQAIPKQIQIAVLIDRGHRIMPVSPNFVGLELATTIQQHVSVEISKNKQQIRSFLV